MTSYDRMFPNQDFVSPDALGIWLHFLLHYGSRCENKTVFIDIKSMQSFEKWMGNIAEHFKNIILSSIGNFTNIIKFKQWWKL